MTRTNVYLLTTTSTEARIDKWCRICQRRGHLGSEHGDWSKLKDEKH